MLPSRIRLSFEQRVGKESGIEVAVEYQMKPVRRVMAENQGLMMLDDENGSAMGVSSAISSEVYVVSDSDMRPLSPKPVDVESDLPGMDELCEQYAVSLADLVSCYAFCWIALMLIFHYAGMHFVRNGYQLL
ncbi:hypothetical protein Nepgr_018827 [Nepenthes gracilis]|uniref:Uncharacterized protein n=1 Tax=Nepenthes gracilis TaxID=150966 RepID=A0AAD3SVY3_NEPGR|nr:hypothetical protein Nepgr_018827 [Nepenthes gracilis]